MASWYGLLGVKLKGIEKLVQKLGKQLKINDINDIGQHFLYKIRLFWATLTEQNGLRNVAETWIRVVTVFLALQLALITFLLSSEHAVNNKEIFIAFNYFGQGMVIPMGMALAMFIGARDPRMTRFSIQTVLDGGVACTAASVVISSISAGYGAFVFTNDLALSIVIPISLICAMSIFYPLFYYRYLHKKSN